MAGGSTACSPPCLIIWCWRCHQEMCVGPPCLGPVLAFSVVLHRLLWVSPVAVLPHTLPGGRLCPLPKSSRGAWAGQIPQQGDGPLFHEALSAAAVLGLTAGLRAPCWAGGLSAAPS